MIGVRHALVAALLGAFATQIDMAAASPASGQARVAVYQPQDADSRALHTVGNRYEDWHNDDYDDDDGDDSYHPRWHDRYDYRPFQHRRFFCRPLYRHADLRYGHNHGVRALLCHNRHGYSFVVPANRFWLYD
ncbi:MAG: hypothetical protein U1F68_10450 [Gammaproteobacteria bacterium]